MSVKEVQTDTAMSRRVTGGMSDSEMGKGAKTMSKCIMSSKDFRKLSKRDFDNGAVIGEIWNGLHNREQLQAELDTAKKRIAELEAHLTRTVRGFIQGA